MSSEKRRKDNIKQIDQILGKGGTLSKSIAGYEHRSQQILMSKDVSNALMLDETLIVEAPTGTGKTLAYLVAAALSRKRVAISTGTKNLQEQLFFRDIPFLRSNIFKNLKAALLKGRANFVCHQRLSNFLRQPYLRGIAEENALNQILSWYEKTREHGQGDRAELENLPDDDPVWPEICSTTETCLGKKCPDRENCFILRMKAKAAESDIMVVNHHLLCSDLAVKESGYGEVIPRYEALIVDEAHGLEEAATQHFGFHLSLFRVLRFARDARAELALTSLKPETYIALLENMERHSRRIFDSFSEISSQRTRITEISPEQIEARDVVSGSCALLASTISNIPSPSEDLRSLARRVEAISREFQIVLNPEPDGEYACWGERREKYIFLHASPIDVGASLKDNLYTKVASVVFTSATLSSGGKFDYFKSRLSISPPVNEVILDTPFDYGAQTMLYIPRAMPEPNDRQFAEALTPVIKEVLIRTKGRAFVLFTSHKNMETVHRLLSGKLPFPMLVQGQKPKSRLLEEFQELQGCVLFATASFWEGVDVQGEALSCVIVDRLPFAPPNDPIISARVDKIKRSGGEPFYSLQVPMAVIALKQGFGRLIRTRSDKGILCMLDLRILTKSYGKIFLKSLYETPLSRELRDIEEFFSKNGQRDHA